MTTERFVDYAFNATGAPSGSPPTGGDRKLPDRMAEVVNVKDYGAYGDGSHDDTLAVQAALDAAFGPASNSHGKTGALNRSVYFPAGGYRTTAPLVVTGVQGGKIYGDGPALSTIQLVPTTITPVNSEGFTPVLWLNGFYKGSIRDLNFVGPSDTVTWSTVCIWFGPDGTSVEAGGGGSGSNGNLFENVNTSGTTYGIIHGSAHSAAVSENTYINCAFGSAGVGSGHDLIGFYCSGGNTLNMKVIGGGCAGCLVGFKTNNSATITSIISVAMDNNYQDMDFAASASPIVIGVRTEGGAFLKTGSTPTVVINCNQANIGGTINGYTLGAAATFSGYIDNPSAPTLTIVSGSAVGMRPGMKVYGSGVLAGQALNLPVPGTSNKWSVILAQNLGSAGSPVAMTAGSIFIATSLGTAPYISIRPLAGTDGVNSLPSGFGGGASLIGRIAYRPVPGVFLGSIAHVGTTSFFTKYLPGSTGEIFPGMFLQNNGATTGVTAHQQIVAGTGNPNEYQLSIGFPTQADVGSIAFPVDMKISNTDAGGDPNLGVFGITDRGSPSNVGTAVSPASFTSHPVLFEINGAGSLIADGCGGEADSVIKADNNSVMYLRGCFFNDQIHGGISADLFTYSQGIVVQYDNLFTQNPTVANLPVMPNQGMKGLQMFVTDYNGALTWGASVIGHGSGSTTVNVRCTGTDWLIT